MPPTTTRPPKAPCTSPRPAPPASPPGAGSASPSAPPSSAVALLRQAHAALAEARWEEEPSERYATSYLAALRGAAAVLALRGRPHRGRSRPTSAWVLLAKVAPEHAEWAAFFDAASETRAAVRSGITRGVTRRGADDLLRQASQFVGLVDRSLHGGVACVRPGR